MAATADYDEILRALRWSIRDGLVFEIRSIARERSFVNRGYFNDPEIAANAICNIDNEGIAGWYMTLNPVRPELLARCVNRIQTAKSGATTSDREILYRRELMIDFDADRNSGISSTDHEHILALDHTKYVTDELTRKFGWPVAALIDSGNGGHARYWLDDIPNEDSSTQLAQRIMRTLAKQYNTAGVKIDISVFNASRICRIPGTVARKGDSVADRPHRMARIIREFDPIDNLHTRAMQAFLDDAGDVFTPPQPGRHIVEYPDDEKRWKDINVLARTRIHDWVPHIIGDIAKPSGSGYRISAEDMGDGREEAVSITAEYGIKNFGEHDMGDPTEGRRTPITLLSEVKTDGDKVKASELLYDTLGESPKLTALKPDGPIATLQDTTGAFTGIPPILFGETRKFATIRSYEDIMAASVMETTYLIDQLLAECTHSVLSGPAKSGKSTLTYNLALHVLFGKNFLHRAVKRANVLWVALEERDYRFHRKIQQQLAALKSMYWAETTPEEEREAFSRLAFWTRDSRTDKLDPLPVGRAGARHLVNVMSEYKSDLKDWLVIIEPVLQFHEENLTSRNLIKMEYEQIEIINDVVTDYTGGNCTILSIKHDRKSPAGGNRGTVNPMDNVAGTVAQQGAPDSQIQIFAKSAYNFEELAWLVIQSRDFGRTQIPMLSNGDFYTSPPSDMQVPDFQEYMKQELAERKVNKGSSSDLINKITIELQSHPLGIGATKLAGILNSDYQNVSRALTKLVDTGIVDRIPINGNTNKFALAENNGIVTGPLPDWF
jgi:hypothetical protein